MARLIESCLWVDFTRLKSPPGFKAMIQPWILALLATLCEPVAFEVLRHATTQECRWIEAQFATLPVLAAPPRLWRDATWLGQPCRDREINAGSLDLRIASCALHHEGQFVTVEADYVAIARPAPLRVLRLSRNIPDPVGFQA
jgi:predicted nucleic acid-binding protein